MRFILMGDRHNSLTKPENRIDVDFFETVKRKDEEIMKIAHTYDADAILHAGDFWTDGDAKIKYAFLSEIVNRWTGEQNYKKIPILGIAGNHDLIGNNIKSLPETTSGLAHALNHLPLVTKENPYIFQMENGKTVAITGTHYHLNMDKPAHINDYIIDEKLGDYHIHIVHGMLVNKGLGTIIRHTTIDQIKHTKADITLCGHDHIGFPTTEYDGKFFLNPGAIVRLKNDIKEMTRVVKVVLVEITEKGITLTDIPLKTALDGKLVLSREVLEKKKEKQFAVESMKSQIKQLEITQKVRFDDILEEIYTDRNIDKSIVKDLSRRLNEKQIANTPATLAPADTWITELEIINFHSHEHTIVDFSKNLNVILGESRQGKTSILRAIRWVLENKPTGKSIIRHGANYCTVKMKLANGTIIIREIGDKINGYKIIMPNGDVHEGNTKLVGTVQGLCGFNNMIIDSKLSMPINFMRQGTGWYLIGDNVTSTDRARILGAIQNTNSADAIVKDLDKENTQHSTIIKNNNKQIDVTFDEIEKVSKEKQLLEKTRLIVEKKLLVKNIENYIELKKDFDEKNRIADVLKNGFDELKIINAFNKIEKHIKSIDEIFDNSNIYKDETLKMVSIEDKLKILEKISDAEERVITLKQKVEKYDFIYENAVIVRKEESRQTKISTMMESLLKVKDFSDIEHIKKLLLKKEDIQTNFEIFTNSQCAIEKSERFIENSKIVEEYSDIKNKIIQNLSTIENVSQYAKEYEVSEKEVNKQEGLVDKNEKELTSLIEQKGKILKDAKICPTCMGTINDDIIKNLFDKEEY